MNPWLLLGLAGLLEIVWAIALKQSEGFTRIGPTVVTSVGAFASFWLLAAALKALPAGTGYAVWTGIGAIGVAVVGIVWLGESASPLKLAGIALIVSGIAALKMA